MARNALDDMNDPGLLFRFAVWLGLANIRVRIIETDRRAIDPESRDVRAFAGRVVGFQYRKVYGSKLEWCFANIQMNEPELCRRHGVPARQARPMYERSIGPDGAWEWRF